MRADREPGERERGAHREVAALLAGGAGEVPQLVARADRDAREREPRADAGHVAVAGVVVVDGGRVDDAAGVLALERVVGHDADRAERADVADAVDDGRADVVDVVGDLAVLDRERDLADAHVAEAALDADVDVVRGHGGGRVDAADVVLLVAEVLQHDAALARQVVEVELDVAVARQPADDLVLRVDGQADVAGGHVQVAVLEAVLAGVGVAALDLDLHEARQGRLGRGRQGYRGETGDRDRYGCLREFHSGVLSNQSSAGTVGDVRVVQRDNPSQRV